MASDLPEVWLRGPLPGVPPLLQPTAHALLQASEEVGERLLDFPDALLWERPAGVASVGFHLQHLTGVLDRLFTFAAAKPLTEDQLRSLKAEGINDPSLTTASLVAAFQQQVIKSVQMLIQVDERTLSQARGVGRSQLPSTVIGLLTHAAEHTMRHTGQLLVTVKVVKLQSQR